METIKPFFSLFEVRQYCAESAIYWVWCSVPSTKMIFHVSLTLKQGRLNYLTEYSWFPVEYRVATTPLHRTRFWLIFFSYAHVVPRAFYLVIGASPPSLLRATNLALSLGIPLQGMPGDVGNRLRYSSRFYRLIMRVNIDTHFGCITGKNTSLFFWRGILTNINHWNSGWSMNQISIFNAYFYEPNAINTYCYQYQ